VCLPAATIPSNGGGSRLMMADTTTRKRTVMPVSAAFARSIVAGGARRKIPLL
jgi:hypothetical protein